MRKTGKDAGPRTQSAVLKRLAARLFPLSIAALAMAPTGASGGGLGALANTVEGIGNLMSVAQFFIKTHIKSENPVCWKASYGRGVGKIPTSCPAGMEEQAALCYKNCNPGYKGAGPLCWQASCPAGFRNDPAHCAKPSGAYGRGAGYALWDEQLCFRKHGSCEKYGLMWYPKCREGFRAIGCCICSPACPDGMLDIGVSCAKKSYGRGVGIPRICSADVQEQAGLCYDKCSEGYGGAGPVCWQDCPAHHPVNCGALCSTSKPACASAVIDMILAPIQMLISVIGLITTGGAASVAINAAKTAVKIVGNAVGKAAQKIAVKAGVQLAIKTISQSVLKSILKTVARSVILKTLQNTAIDTLKGAAKAAAQSIAGSIVAAAIKKEMDAKGFAEDLGKDIAMSLDPTGIASVVDAFNKPLCTSLKEPPLIQPQCGVCFFDKKLAEVDRIIQWIKDHPNETPKETYQRHCSFEMARRSELLIDSLKDYEFDNKAQSVRFYKNGCGKGANLTLAMYDWWDQQVHAQTAQSDMNLPQRAAGKVSSYMLVRMFNGRPAPPCGVCLHEKPGYSGQKWCTSLDSTHLRRSWLNNRASSLQVLQEGCPGAKVEIFEHINFAGEKLEVANSIPNLSTLARSRGRNWDNEISSLRFHPGPPPAAAAGKATAAATAALSRAPTPAKQAAPVFTGDAAKNWTKLPGAALDVGVGANGDAWMVGTDRGVWRWVSNNWRRMRSTNVARIAVGPPGKVWVIGANRSTQHWVGGQFRTVRGAANDVGVGADGTVWAIGINSRPYRWTGSRWSVMPGKGLARIAVDPKGQPWAVDNQRRILRFAGGRWNRLPGAAHDIGIGPSGAVWIIGVDARYPYRWNPTSRRWDQMRGASMSNIAVGPRGPWAADRMRRIWRWGGR